MTGYESGHVSLRFSGMSGGLVRVATAMAVGAALLWLGGLLAFVGRIDQPAPTSGLQADGIIVLTGGAERLNAALGLLQNGQAQRLLITGVHPEIKAEDLSTVTIGTKQLFECCVDLGKSARNTQGNAAEAAVWAQEHRYRKLIIVTANYHMPRSLLEFRAAMPSAELIAYPVSPPDLMLKAWWQHPGTTSLLASEYTKYLLSLARLGPIGASSPTIAQAS